RRKLAADLSARNRLQESAAAAGESVRAGKAERADAAGGTPTAATGTVALVRLRRSVHRRVEVPLWRCFPPRVESNCVLATGRGEQLDTEGQLAEPTGLIARDTNSIRPY